MVKMAKVINLAAFNEDQERARQEMIKKKREKKAEIAEVDGKILALRNEESGLKKEYEKVSRRNWTYRENFDAAVAPILDKLLTIEDKLIKLKDKRAKLMRK